MSAGLPPSITGQTTVRRPRRARGLVRLLVGSLAVVALVLLTDPRAVLARLRVLDPAWLAVALAVQAVAKVVWAWRWALVLRLVGMSATLGRLVRALLVGLFFGNVLPTSFGGDLARAHWIAEDRSQYGPSLFGVFIERFVGFACLGWVALPGAFFLLRQRPAAEIVWLLTALLALAASLLLLSPPVFAVAARLLLPGRRLADLRARADRALRTLQEDARLRWSIYVLSAAVHVAGVMYYAALGIGLGLPLEAWHYLVLVPLTTVATAFPFTFNGLGVREGALVVLVGALGVDMSPAESVSLGLAAFAVNLLVSLAGGLAFFAGDRRGLPTPPEIPAGGAGEPVLEEPTAPRGRSGSARR